MTDSTPDALAPDWLFVDARCRDRRCASKNAYRMVGRCANCRVENVLVMFTAEHDTCEVECPTCGCRRVRVTRLATEEEIPVG